MGAFVLSPQFNPPQPPITVGSVGQVLTVNAAGGLDFEANGGGAGLSARYAYASPNGASNNVNPGGGFPGTTAFRLIVTLPAGGAAWSGLLAGVDGQEGVIFNNDAANTLDLGLEDGNSLAANRFAGRSGLGPASIPPQALLFLVYDATIQRWLVL